MELAIKRIYLKTGREVSVLKLNITWTIENFLNYIKHSFSDTIPAGCYDSLDE